MEPLGLTFDVKSFERTTMYSRVQRARGARVSLFRYGLGQGLPRTGTRSPTRCSAPLGSPSCCNYSLVGASPDLLSKAGYTVTDVPSVDDQIKTANQQTGDARYQAWADLDTFMMELVVPWAPYQFDNRVDITSERIVSYSSTSSPGCRRMTSTASIPKPSRR